MTARALAAAALAIGLAQPATSSASCQFNGVTPVAFGTYNPFTILATDSAGSFTYRCSIGEIITIWIDGGLIQNILTRQMTRVGGGTTPLMYQLYSDALRLLPWGNTILTQVGPILGSTTDRVVAVYGRIFALQDVQPGMYSDTVVITINF